MVGWVMRGSRSGSFMRVRPRGAVLPVPLTGLPLLPAALADDDGGSSEAVGRPWKLRDTLTGLFDDVRGWCSVGGERGMAVERRKRG